MNTKVLIICSIHGEFTQQLNNHLQGRGCNKCGIEARAKKRIGSVIGKVEDFLARAKEVHKDKYDYSKVNYNGIRAAVTIICKIHGEFNQIARNHMNGNGCKECGKLISAKSGNQKLTNEEFIRRSKVAHGNLYDYSKSVYITSFQKVKVGCRKHGEFEVDPRKHFKGYGCPICTGCGVSFAQLEWLQFKETTTGQDIIYKGGKHNKEEAFRFDKKLYRVDGYCKETNTVYEFLGCWYHGCPNCRDESIVHPWSKKTMKHLYKETMNRKSIFEQNGYTVEYIWECEWTQQKKNTQVRLE